MKERIGTVLHWVGLILLIYTNGVGLFLSVEPNTVCGYSTISNGIFLFYFFIALIFLGFGWSCNYIFTGRTHILPGSEAVRKFLGTFISTYLLFMVMFLFSKDCV